jgi:hypothetical protein
MIGKGKLAPGRTVLSAASDSDAVVETEGIHYAAVADDAKHLHVGLGHGI